MKGVRLGAVRPCCMLLPAGFLCFVKSKMAAGISDCVSPLLGLADEIIDLILSYSLLDYGDLCHFAQTCVRFREIANYSELWKKKAHFR